MHVAIIYNVLDVTNNDGRHLYKFLESSEKILIIF